MNDEDEFLKFMRTGKQLTAANRPMRLRLGFPGGVNDDMLLPQRVSGVESICGGIEYHIQCAATDASLQLKQFIARPAELQFVTDRGQLRCVGGIITEASAGNSDGGIATFKLVLRDAMAIMEKRVNSRLFRRMNEIEVVELLLGEWRLSNPVLGTAFEYEVDRFIGEHPRREFIMQHNESDAAFCDRLLRRRGISWFIRCGRAAGTNVAPGDDWPAHTLVLFTDANRLKQNAAGTVRFHRDSATEERDTITSWSAVRRLQPGSITRHSWNYANVAGAGFMLTDSESVADQGGGKLLAASLNDYLIEAPHTGDDHEDHMLLGRLRMSRHDYETKCFHAEGVVRDLNSGESFILEGHPEIDTHPAAEREFVVTELYVEAHSNLPGPLAARVERLFAGNRWEPGGTGALLAEQGKSEFGALRFRSRITCVRRGIPIVPAFDPRTDLPHPQPQSALVVGPQGEEVYCDQQGRVKIRFPGMRADDHTHASGTGANDDAGASAWVRVASNWAGNGSGSRQCGAIALPRAGTEVLVIFLGGDPDKPVIIGQMFHHQAPPPALSEAGDLPGNRYLSGIKSREVRGARANQLRFDDTSGEISAQLASDHGRSELNLGYLTEPRSQGAGRPRGEGAELRSDKAVAVRGGQGVLISAHACAGGREAQLARAELIGLSDVLQSVAEQLAKLAVTHASDDASGPQLSQLIDRLKHLHDATNVGKAAVAHNADGGAGQPGAQPIVAISAPAGVIVASEQGLALGAQTNVDILSASDTRLSAGSNVLLRAMRGVSLFAHKIGMKLIAASGNIEIQTHKDDIALQSAKNIVLTAAEGIIFQAKKISFIAEGVQIDLAAGAIVEQCTGAYTIKSSSFSHVSGGNGNPTGLNLPSTELATDERIVLLNSQTGLPVKGQRYFARHADGAAIEGVTDDQGRTDIISSGAIGEIEITLFPR